MELRLIRNSLLLLFLLCLEPAAPSSPPSTARPSATRPITTSPNTVAICYTRAERMPEEWYRVNQTHPSAPGDLELEVNLQNRPSGASLSVRWSISVDGSMSNITGTWIELKKNQTVRYRCEYQPNFSANPARYAGLEKLFFNFTATEVQIEPGDHLSATVYNLPTPSFETLGKQMKTKDITVAGCDDKQMKNHLTCVNREALMSGINAKAVCVGDEVVVTFSSSSKSEEYKIFLYREDKKLNWTRRQTRREVKTVTEKLKYPGPCDKLEVDIIPYFDFCGCCCKSHNVTCTKPEPVKPVKPEKPDNTALLIMAGCAAAVAVLLILICFFTSDSRNLLQKTAPPNSDSPSTSPSLDPHVFLNCPPDRLWMGRLFVERRRSPVPAGPVRVLLAYPAVDSQFQQAVMALADFLQSRKGLSVVIDMWQRVSLAEQGPLRWLNSQADQADKVLIILPPRHISTSIGAHTDCQKAPLGLGPPDYTVPASAHQLFSLALNLVASSAHDPRQHQKFWVVHLGQTGGSTVPVELRGCRALSLPRDLEKLHQTLAFRPGGASWRPRCRVWPFRCKESSEKVRQAVLQLDKSYSSFSREEMVRLTEVESTP